MTSLLVSLVKKANIAETDILENAGQKDFSHLIGQMYIVGHQAEGMNAVFISFDSFLK